MWKKYPGFKLVAFDEKEKGSVKFVCACAAIVIAFSFVLFIRARDAGAVELHPGDILVVDKLYGTIIAVDPETRDRVIVSTFNRGLGPSLVSPIGIAVDRAGQILVAGRATLYRVDPETGNRTYLSNPDVGSGPRFMDLIGVAVELDGAVIVSDAGRGAIVEVDPATGDRTIVSAAAQAPLCRGTKIPFPCCTGMRTGAGCDPQVGSGPDFRAPFGLAVEPDGDILVTDLALLAVLRVDRATGDREIVSVAGRSQECGFAEPGCFALHFPYPCCKAEGIGDGTAPCSEEEVTPYACCTGAETGDGTPPCSSAGSGPVFQGPLSIALAPGGDVIVTDVRQQMFEKAALLRVQPSSGDRSVLSSAAVGSGPMFRVLMQAKVDSTGRVLVTDEGWKGILEVDTKTGDRSFFSTPDQSALCYGPGAPFPCCTGLKMGTGCTAGVGDGPAVNSAQGLYVIPQDPCVGPAPGVEWKNHGEYVSDSASRAQSDSKAGLIGRNEKGALIRRAGRGDCPIH